MNTEKNTIIHYIGREWHSKFIIARTNCGIYWKDCNEYSDDKEYVTCKKCIKSFNKKTTQKHEPTNTKARG